MEIQTRTDTGRTRGKNEDAIGVWQDNGWAVVVLADGLGGHRSGEVASQMVVDLILTFIRERHHEYDRWDTMMREAADYANAQIYRKAGSELAFAGMGATVVFACLIPNELHLAHAGDSRAYLCGEDGLVQITIDHCVSNEFLQQGREVSESMRHMVTRAMGTEPTVQIDYQCVKPALGTLLLLCSDGLSNELSTREIEEILRSEDSLSAKADRLIERANEKGGKDNITIALVDWRGGHA